MLTHLIVGLGFNTQHVQDKSLVHKTHHVCKYSCEKLHEKTCSHKIMCPIGKHVATCSEGTYI